MEVDGDDITTNRLKMEELSSQGLSLTTTTEQVIKSTPPSSKPEENPSEVS